MDGKAQSEAQGLRKTRQHQGSDKCQLAPRDALRTVMVAPCGPGSCVCLLTAPRHTPRYSGRTHTRNILERLKLKHLQGKRNQNQTFILIVSNVPLKHSKKIFSAQKSRLQLCKCYLIYPTFSLKMPDIENGILNVSIPRQLVIFERNNRLSLLL